MLTFFTSRDDLTIRLNFEDIQSLDNHLVDGYDDWVNGLPNHWKRDGFLEKHTPILITSRFGQNASIALPNNEDQEAEDWHQERDYSKIAFLTFALATSIEYVSLDHMLNHLHA
jgi:hypothetical protein